MATVNPLSTSVLPIQTGESDRPLKIVFFPLTWVLAHVGRCVEIGKELRAQGHEVVFAGDDPTHPRSRLSHAAKEGFRTVHVKEPNWPYAWERFHNRGALLSIWDFMHSQEWAPLDEIVEDIIRVAREEEADLIVGDASVGVSTAGHILGIPAAGVLNAYNSHFYRPFTIYRTLIELFDRLHWSRIRNRVYARHNVKPVNALQLLKQTPLLSPDLKEFHAPHGSFPNWHPIGPLVSETPFALPEWYDELSDGTPNVYITMGSTGLLEPLLRRSYGALAEAPYRFIVTTGGQVSEEGMAMAPDNFRFATYAPGSKLMRHVSAMVFHGGNGSMYQALGMGVPMLALPSHLEQQVGMSILKREGFGRMGCSRRITGDQLLAEIRTLVEDPSYRANAWRFRNAVKHSDGRALGAEILVRHARAHAGAAVVAAG